MSNERFSMTDKQTYDMIERVHDKVNLLTEEVRQNNHIKDEVEKIHIKMDKQNKQINCNTKNISNVEENLKGQKEYKNKILTFITILSLIVAILSNIGVI